MDIKTLIDRLRGIERGYLLADEATAGEAADALELLLDRLKIEKDRTKILEKAVLVTRLVTKRERK